MIIQRFYRRFAAGLNGRRQRAALRAAHALARGWLARARIMALHRAASRLQAGARAWLVRGRTFRVRAVAQSTIAAAWRGRQWRLENEHVLNRIAEARARRARAAAGRVVTRAAKRYLASRRLQRLRRGVRALRVASWRTRRRGELFASRRAARVLRRALACFLFKMRIARSRPWIAIGKDLWATRVARVAESGALARAALSDAAAALPGGFAARAAAAADALDDALDAARASSAAAGGDAGRVSSATTTPTKAPIPLPSAAAFAATPRDTALRGAVALDVDLLSAHFAAAWPGGLSRGLSLFARKLRALPGGGGSLAGLALGAGHAVAISAASDGTPLPGVYTWGYGDTGALGHARATGEPVPRRIDDGAFAVAAGDKAGSALRGFRAVAAGDAHTLALGDDGLVFAWGSARGGALGVPCVEKWGAPPQKKEIALENSDSQPSFPPICSDLSAS